jgi:hypothetical protein
MISNRTTKRTMILVLGMLALACVEAPGADAGTYYGFTIGVSNAPPPPRIVLAERPDLVAVPGSLVYSVRNVDYDVWRYNGAYYAYNDGYWYRSSKTSGPYVVVDVRRVPETILRVPAQSWKHHPHGGPPGQMKKGRY